MAQGSGHCCIDYSEYENCPDAYDTLLINAAFGPRDVDDWYTEQLYFEKHGRPLPRSRSTTPSAFFELPSRANLDVPGADGSAPIDAARRPLLRGVDTTVGGQQYSTSQPQTATQAILNLELARRSSFA
jgi:hypothetical protein